MKEFKHVINDPLGMHARPAGMLVKAVAPFASKITVTAPTGSADAKRLMALMRLAAKQGMELTITVEGPDEEKAAAELQAFLTANLYLQPSLGVKPSAGYAPPMHALAVDSRAGARPRRTGLCCRAFSGTGFLLGIDMEVKAWKPAWQ